MKFTEFSTNLSINLLNFSSNVGILLHDWLYIKDLKSVFTSGLKLLISFLISESIAFSMEWSALRFFSNMSTKVPLFLLAPSISFAL